MTEEVEVLARTAALALETAVNREGDILDVGSWVVALRKMGARVQKYRSAATNAPPGFFVADDLGGVIYFNVLAPPLQVCKVLAHEGTHFFLAQYNRSGLRRKAPENYDDRGRSRQHRAARRVEEILFSQDQVIHR